MDFKQQQINAHKQMLLNLVNKLINTQIIKDEISLNNEIKKESECLNYCILSFCVSNLIVITSKKIFEFLLTIKQNNLINQMYNNNNLNPFLFQENSSIMFSQAPVAPVNINPLNMNQPNIFENNNCFNNFGNISNNFDKIAFIRCIFRTERGDFFTINCKLNEKVEDAIKKYRERSKDYDNKILSYNVNDIRKYSNLTFEELLQKNIIPCQDTINIRVGYI